MGSDRESKGYGKSGLRLYIRTYGCQMNVRDSEVICGLLSTNGYELTADSEAADIIIFNTCSVRQHAEDKVWSEIGKYGAKRVSKLQKTEDGGRRKDEGRRKTDDGRRKILGIVGCMAQNYKQQIFERFPQVDFVVGPADIHQIPDILSKLSPQIHLRAELPLSSGLTSEVVARYSTHQPSTRGILERKIWETDSQTRPEEIYHTGFHEDKEHAYVVISEGCSNFCTYCVVPYVRGPLRHRNHPDIIREIEEAVSAGITRVTLLGQNVNSYGLEVTSHKPPVKFIDLLAMVNGIKGIKEFSFITSHPKDTSLELFKAMAQLERLKKYLHLPVQSGSDRILKLMNRGYTRKFYLDLARNYRTIVKDGFLTTDIIVGYPTETEADFEDTFSLAKEVEFDAGFIFKYSPRPHAASAAVADDVSRQEKEHRHKLVLDLQKGISKRKSGRIV